MGRDGRAYTREEFVDFDGADKGECQWDWAEAAIGATSEETTMLRVTVRNALTSDFVCGLDIDAGAGVQTLCQRVAEVIEQPCSAVMLLDSATSQPLAAETVGRQAEAVRDAEGRLALDVRLVVQCLTDKADALLQRVCRTEHRPTCLFERFGKGNGKGRMTSGPGGMQWVEYQEALSHDWPKTVQELQAFVTVVTTIVNGGPAGPPLPADIAACVEVLACGEVEMWVMGSGCRDNDLQIAPRGGMEEIVKNRDWVAVRSIFRPQAGLRGLYKREPEYEGAPVFAGGAKRDLLYISICAECAYCLCSRSPSLIVAHVIDINGKLGSLFGGEPMFGAVWKLKLTADGVGRTKALPDPDDEFWAKAFSVEWWQEAVDGGMDAYFHRPCRPSKGKGKGFPQHPNFGCVQAERIASDFLAFLGELDSR